MIDPKIAARTFACYRCSTIFPEEDFEFEERICPCCGENSVVSFQEALDIINNHYLDSEFEQEEILERHDIF